MPDSAFAKALEANKEWASQTLTSSPGFLEETAKGQAPSILWLGCCDSRVPESTILNMKPGEAFTHRNIANIISSTDLSSLAVIEFAVAALKVNHIIVCGHTGCGGVAAALKNEKIGVIDAWLAPLRALRARLVENGTMEGKSKEEQSLALVEENVREGVKVVRSNTNVLAAVKERGLEVHGVVYELATGRLRELDTKENEKEARARIEAFTT